MLNEKEEQETILTKEILFAHVAKVIWVILPSTPTLKTSIKVKILPMIKSPFLEAKDPQYLWTAMMQIATMISI